MIPTGGALLWALWLTLGAGAVKARVLVQSHPGADWAGGREGVTVTAGIPNKFWSKMMKRNEPGLVGKIINPEEKEEDKLAAPAAAEHLAASVSSVSRNQQGQGLEEGQELEGDEQQTEYGENDEDLAQEEDEEQDQELSQMKKHSRDPGQDQGQAQTTEQEQNQKQGEIQETEKEKEREGEEQGREEAQDQVQELERRQGQGKVGQRQEEEAGGLEESQSLGRELERQQELEPPKAKEQPQKQVGKQTRKQHHVHMQEEEEQEEPEQLQMEEQERERGEEEEQQKEPQQQIQQQWREQELPQAKEQQKILVPEQQQQIQKLAQELLQEKEPQQQPPARTEGPAWKQLALKASEQESMGLDPAHRRKGPGIFPFLGFGTYEPHQRPPELEQIPFQPHQRPPQPEQRPPQLEQIPFQPHQRPPQLEQIPFQPHQRPPQLEQRPPQLEQIPFQPHQRPPQLEFSNTGSIPSLDMHLVMLAWSPWECHCSTGTMSRVRRGIFLGFTWRLRPGPLETQRQPCTYAQCHCNQERKECPSDHILCSSTPGACNHRAFLTSLASPENTINETAFWKQVQDGLDEVWVGLRSLVTKEKKIKRNQR
ncbi:transcription factor SPT20 homolog [Vombatus ursinus]|uniref:Uncharacterized protein n=1 Tax=Vombatus ursinus TaxID=29139 RepID=A0A4X2LC39_VOMUR|nr:transcription factor SPT20 homolog [Vombatus ursinus]XP_027717590.1 transcription factor SPT20 homolog [Vombatus ursinus]